MGRMKQLFVSFWRVWYVKYIVVCVLGVLIVGFLDDNSVLSHVNNMQRIEELQGEIDVYEAQNQENVKRIRQLDENAKEVEKIARERYFMKADDEDIFVLSDDEVNNEKPVKNENAQ